MAKRRSKAKGKTKSYVFLSAAELGQVEALVEGLEGICNQARLVQLGLKESLAMVERLHVHTVNELVALVERIHFLLAPAGGAKHDSEKLDPEGGPPPGYVQELERQLGIKGDDVAAAVDCVTRAEHIDALGNPIIVIDDQADKEQVQCPEGNPSAAAGIPAGDVSANGTGTRAAGSRLGSTPTSIGDTAGPGPSCSSPARRTRKRTGKPHPGSAELEKGG